MSWTRGSVSTASSARADVFLRLGPGPTKKGERGNLMVDYCDELCVCGETRTRHRTVVVNAGVGGESGCTRFRPVERLNRSESTVVGWEAEAYDRGYARGVEDAQSGQDERRPRRQGRVRMTVDGRARDSYAELYVPVEGVVGGLHNFMESGDKPIVLEQFYSNGDGVRVTLERIPRTADSAMTEKQARDRLRRISAEVENLRLHGWGVEHWDDPVVGHCMRLEPLLVPTKTAEATELCPHHGGEGGRMLCANSKGHAGGHDFTREDRAAKMAMWEANDAPLLAGGGS